MTIKSECIRGAGNDAFTRHHVFWLPLIYLSVRRISADIKLLKIKSTPSGPCAETLASVCAHFAKTKVGNRAVAMAAPSATLTAIYLTIWLGERLLCATVVL